MFWVLVLIVWVGCVAGVALRFALGREDAPHPTAWDEQDVLPRLLEPYQVTIPVQGERYVALPVAAKDEVA